MIPGDCPFCGYYLSGAELLEGLCPDCGREIPDYRYESDVEEWSS